MSLREVVLSGGDVRGVRTSLRGVGPINKLAEGCEAMGRIPDVSELISGPSGTLPQDRTWRSEHGGFNDRSVSPAHREGRRDGVR